MRSLRFGLVLAITGLFVPLICLPLAEDYRRNAGLVANIQSMSVPIARDKREPDFRVVDTLEHEQHIRLVEAEGTTLGFPESLSDGEIEAAINAERQFQKKAPRPKFMRFYGWRVTYEGKRIPFRYIASVGALLILIGSVMIVLNARRA
jgi:hypothetical protein